ncbi:MAG: decarboxylating 6-phosphogluconate dehydrogenase [Acidimicrobiia bacterium]|nr:decarboxylating 6-phosphogluconate dehydrogenase [Acidimicrobiia bacterium]
MDVGMIGLGKMGANMARRLIEADHRVVGFDLNQDAVADLVATGAEGAPSLEAMAALLPTPRVLWIMVPAGRPVEATIEGLLPHLEPGDILIDGGNSNYKDTARRGAECLAAGLNMIDVGTSGGIWGLTEGYSMMVGGDDQAVSTITPILETLAPSPTTGWGHVGPSGAGHFAKMVHNGVEYGLMQAYAEGFAIMAAKDEFDLDLHQVAEIWRFGSVVRSWLLDLTADALAENASMEGIAPFVPDSGEGRWTVKESIDLNVSAPVITLSLLRRIASRDEVEYSDRLVSAMRHQFGGHAVKTE